MQEWVIQREIAAPQNIVFATIADHAAYASFVPTVRRSIVVEHGAARLMTVTGGLLTFREEILRCEPPSLLVYSVRNLLIVEEHQATVQVSATGPGSARMHYRSQASPRIPFAVAMLKPFVANLADAIAREAERRARP
jgi:uncharacterized protein YndB with AHSA1/START domain